MLRKHAVKFNNQWDCYPPGVLWAYRNMPHKATKEKPSYLLYGYDCRSPTEAAFLPVKAHGYADPLEYREELILSLTLGQELAAVSIKETRAHYKQQYDFHATSGGYSIGDLVLVKFPHEKSGRSQKLSHPWHGPYWVIQRNDPDLIVVKQFFLEQGSIPIHQLRVCVYTLLYLRIGIYWHGINSHSAGGVPGWVEKLTLRVGSRTIQ